MKKQIRNTSFFILAAFVLSACAATTVVDKPVEFAVKSVHTSSSNGSLPPKYRKSYSTTMNSDLKVTKIVKDSQDKTVSNTSIQITQAQFDNLVKEIDLSLLKTKPPASRRPLPPGSSSKSVSIETNDGNYQFYNGGHYPDAINRLFGNIDQLFTR